MRPGESEQSFLLRALDFAARKHRDQRRKGSEAPPYINHPIAVARVLAEVGGVTDAITLAGALLHDTVEDTETTPGEIEAEFGAEVRRLVSEVTDDKSLPRAERKRLQVERTPVASERAKLVKLGDKICNLIDLVQAPPVGWTRERQKDYLDWTVQVVAGCRGLNPALDRFYDETVGRSRAALAEGS
jgi:guanosine-3',5'-bis(diphosphate) 3'-pyrophosphohydrolase